MPGLTFTVQRYNAELLTPVAAFLALQETDKAGELMLCESVLQGAERGRYSCIICGYRETLRIERVTGDGEAKRAVAAFAAKAAGDIPEGLPAAAYGAFGYVSYDGVRDTERLPDANPKNTGAPDVFLALPEHVLLFDNARDSLYIVTPAAMPEGERNAARLAQTVFAGASSARAPQEDTAPPPQNAPRDALRDGAVKSHITRETYEAYVRRCKDYILAGDAFQIVPSQRFSAPLKQEEAFAFYRTLRRLNPSPYCFFMQAGASVLTGCSPETLIKTEKGVLHMRPIAGTRPRGRDAAEDTRLERELLADEKELAEHLMLVDLCRNDIGRVAVPGSVTVSELNIVERYSHVMHIVSHVTGTLREEVSAAEALFSAMPVGTVSGAPKVRAMEIIDELEQERRGFYAGGAGYFSANGDAEFCITLRSALIENNTLYMQAGAGIVADSDPATEYEETVSKASALMQAWLSVTAKT